MNLNLFNTKNLNKVIFTAILFADDDELNFNHLRLLTSQEFKNVGS